MSKMEKGTNPIKGRIIMAAQSTGRVAKSTTMEMLMSYFDFAEIPYRATDADSEHHTLSDRFHEVEKVTLTDPDDLLRLCKRAGIKSSIDLIDIPAQKTDYIVQTFEQYNVVDLAAEDGVRLTVLLFMSDDPAAKESLQKIVSLIGPRADYVAVKVPARFKSRHYVGSSLQKSLLAWGAREVEVPPITQSTLDELQRARAKRGRWLTLAEATQSEHVNKYSQHEVGFVLNRMYVQWQNILPLLISAGIEPRKVVHTVEANSFGHSANFELEIPE